MKKTVLALLSATLVFSSFNIEALADSSSSSETIKQELKEFDKQTSAVEIVEFSEVPQSAPVINFDSVEEFEKAIKEYEEAMNKDEAIEEFYPEVSETSFVPNDKMMLRAATKNGSARIKWHLAEYWEYVYKLYLPVSMWIDFTYSYTGSGSSKKFKKIHDIKSNSGAIPSSWYQTTATHNFYDKNRGVSIKIQGYFLLGVSIGGQPIGAKFPNSYTRKYHF